MTYQKVENDYLFESLISLTNKNKQTGKVSLNFRNGQPKKKRPTTIIKCHFYVFYYTFFFKCDKM